VGDAFAFGSAAVTALLVLGCVIILAQRALALRPALGRLQQAERELAVAQEKLSRIPEWQAALSESDARYEQSQTARFAAEAELARTAGALQQLNHSFEEIRTRLKFYEDARLEISLAARDTALGHFQTEIQQLRNRLNASEAQRESAEQARLKLETVLATTRETLAQERSQADEKLRLLCEARDHLSREFQLLATGVMEHHSAQFQRQSSAQLESMLTPLQEKLREFESSLQLVRKETAVERATLGEQIRQLLQQGNRMTAETTNLTQALKGRVQMQGAWGEMILSSVFERSGLQRDQHYVLQSNIANDEGRRLRPDATVKLPGAPLLVVDAKVSLIAFEAHVNAETDAVRAAQLEEHVRSMRLHVVDLAGKDYHAAVGSAVDYVIMFVPIEGALAAALTADPDLVGYAMDRGVTLATPTTLMLALRTVANVWRVEHRNENAAFIAAEAGRLYDKFVAFVEDMEELGRRLGQAQAGYISAMGKLSEGRGNLTARAEQLKRRGAKTSKSLPPGRLDEDEVALLAAEEP